MHQCIGFRSDSAEIGMKSGRHNVQKRQRSVERSELDGLV
jgi:hypothetical protein